MNRRVKAPLDFHKEMKTDDERRKLQKSIMNKRLSQKERRSALLQDVDKLKKKLRHEESVHKALERAMNRPLGALPRLPPFLPPHTLELLAEVAVLEEEVVRLEQEVMSYRQGLYNAAVNTASKKIPDLIVLPKQLVNRQEEPQTISCDERNTGLQTTLLSASLVRSASSRRLMSSNPIFDQGGNCLIAQASEKTDTNEFSSVLDDGRGKENKLCTNCVEEKTTTMKIPTKRPPRPQMIIKNNDPPKSQSACRLVDREQAQESSPSSSEGGVVEQAQDSIPNKLSEDILNCLCIIFLRLSAAKDKSGRSKAISSIFPLSNENDHKEELRDPYFSGSEIKKKDIGPYKLLYSIEARSIDLKRKTNALFLINRLKILLGKLATVSLEGLTHQQKLAFWINTYNSCMMNAFLEKGIPEAPEMVVELLQKATIMVGGNLLNAVTIEHFILRLPNRFKYPYSQKVAKNVHIRAHKVFGLEWSEPLITFALSCGSRSSPAVRVYSASQVENQLEAAKKDYLQAAVSISVSNKIIIPKLLDWYLLDFAKDLGALLDWVCLQLPNELRNEAIKIVESIKGRKTLSESINIFLHDFSFRYLIHR